MAYPTPSCPPPERCASNRCGRVASSGILRRRPAAPGARLCGPCKRALATNLNTLPALHHESEQQLVLPARQGDLGRCTGLRSDPPPMSDAALEARHDAVVRLATWARLVLDEAVPSSAPPGRNVPELAAFLGRHIDFLAAHPAASSAADEIDHVAAALRLVLTPPKPELVPLGRCVEPGCDATVTLPGRGGEELVLRGPMCDAGHVLTPRQWLSLKWRQSALEAEETARMERTT